LLVFQAMGTVLVWTFRSEFFMQVWWEQTLIPPGSASLGAVLPKIFRNQCNGISLHCNLDFKFGTPLWTQELSIAVHNPWPHYRRTMAVSVPRLPGGHGHGAWKFLQIKMQQTISDSRAELAGWPTSRSVRLRDKCMRVARFNVVLTISQKNQSENA
jgi:hypothetical protein